MTLSPFDRVMLTMAARSATGEILPRRIVADAMGGDEAAAAHPHLARIRTCILDGRPSIFVGPHEANAMLARNPEPPAQASPTGNAYATLMRLYRQADREAAALDGPDQRARQAMDRIAMELLHAAVALCGVAEARPHDATGDAEHQHATADRRAAWGTFVTRTLGAGAAA